MPSAPHNHEIRIQRIQTHRITDFPGFSYLTRLSEKTDPNRVLVAVHGISRRSDLMIRWLGELADVYGYSILAPHFTRHHYPAYQRLGNTRRYVRSDRALIAMLDDAERLLPGLNRCRVALFGFSGGAQFAHRFCLAHPHRVQALAAASAGWYTRLDTDLAFPYGLGPSRKLTDLRFTANGILTTPTLTLVGALDNGQDKALRREPVIDTTQGTNRLARARWWHTHLTEQVQQLSLHGQHHFCELPDTGHNFAHAILRGKLAEQLFQFCSNTNTSTNGGPPDGT